MAIKAKRSFGPKEEEPAIRSVRGGAICDPNNKSATLIRGSNEPAICRSTPGMDPRPRWRVAGKH